MKDFLDSVKYDPNLKILNIEKLTFCHKLVFSELFLNEGFFLISSIPKTLPLFLKLNLEARTNLYPSIINQVIFHLKSSNLDEKGQSVIILNSIIHLIETRLKVTAHFNNNWFSSFLKLHHLKKRAQIFWNHSLCCYLRLLKWLLQ